MWLFYAPVGLWTALLALRYGGYRTLTAANPGIPDGGVVGESKFLILSKLPAGDTIPSALIDEGEPHGLLGEEHERRASALGGADGDEEGDGDLLGVLESGAEADDGFPGHWFSFPCCR